MSESIKQEIVRRAKSYAETHGRDALKESGKTLRGICKGIYVVHLKQGLVDFRIIWIVPEHNLRLGATVYHADGSYPDSITIVNTQGVEENWHDESQNELLLRLLRERMLLEDIAGA